jgi:hypothetical protein
MSKQSDNPIQKTISLLTNSLVQKELDVGHPQLKGFKDSIMSVKDTYVPKVDEIQKALDSAKPKLRAQLMSEFKVAVDSVLADVLRPEQFERFKQLRSQSEGIAIFLDETLREELSMSRDQLAELKPVIEREMKRVSGASGQSSATVRTDAMQNVVDLLSEEQQEKLREILGASFDFGESAAKSVASPQTARPGSGGPKAQSVGSAGTKLAANSPSRGPAGDAFADESVF